MRIPQGTLFIIYTSFKVDVQKITLQMKVKQLDDRLLSSKIDLQQRDLNIKPIEEKLPLKYEIKIINHIYNQRFKKYLDYHWIQQSTVQSARSRRFKRARDQLFHINHSYKFLPTTCTSTKYVDVIWEDFANFYILITLL
jgi:hypothetical protein